MGTTEHAHIPARVHHVQMAAVMSQNLGGMNQMCAKTDLTLVAKRVLLEIIAQIVPGVR